MSGPLNFFHWHNSLHKNNKLTKLNATCLYAEVLSFYTTDLAGYAEVSVYFITTIFHCFYNYSARIQFNH